MQRQRFGQLGDRPGAGIGGRAGGGDHCSLLADPDAEPTRLTGHPEQGFFAAKAKVGDGPGRLRSGGREGERDQSHETGDECREGRADHCTSSMARSI
jgi:hypothetical protein